jgi:hypothetical protein
MRVTLQDSAAQSGTYSLRFETEASCRSPPKPSVFTACLMCFFMLPALPPLAPLSASLVSLMNMCARPYPMSEVAEIPVYFNRNGTTNEPGRNAELVWGQKLMMLPRRVLPTALDLQAQAIGPCSGTNGRPHRPYMQVIPSVAAMHFWPRCHLLGLTGYCPKSAPGCLQVSVS